MSKVSTTPNENNKFYYANIQVKEERPYSNNMKGWFRDTFM